jgi:hypothetical protein
MSNNSQKFTQFALATAGILVGCVTIARPAEAALLTSTFMFGTDSGSLTFDSNRLNPNDDSYDITVAEGLTFQFTFMGMTFTQADDSMASAAFVFTQLIGLDTLINDPTKGEISILDDKFMFTSLTGNETTLGVTYSEPVPEPLTILGTVTAAGFGAFFKRKINQKKGQKDSE